MSHLTVHILSGPNAAGVAHQDFCLPFARIISRLYHIVRLVKDYWEIGGGVNRINVVCFKQNRP